jgi:hypothetical protein
MLQSEMAQSKRGYLNISLPVHREDTIYTYSEGLKHAQSQITRLRNIVAEKDAMVKEREAVVREKDGVIEKLERELMQKEGVIQKLKAVGPGSRWGQRG